MSNKALTKAQARQDYRRAKKSGARYRARMLRVLGEAKHNRQILTASMSRACVCFACRARFRAASISRWVDDDRTAVCPICLLDTVIPNYNWHDDQLLEFAKFWIAEHKRLTQENGEATTEGELRKLKETYEERWDFLGSDVDL